MALRAFPVLLALIAGAVHPTVPCLRLAPPVPGPIVRDFAPVGRYGGHWGIDLEVPLGTPVVPAWAGRVTFAGSVAGMPSVTIDHGGGLRTSYSYLASIDVSAGQWVDRSTRVGTTGVDHDREVLHFSVRVDGVYQDPAAWLRCRRELSGGLRLVPLAAGAAYPARRATRHPRWNLRPASSRPPPRRRGRVPRARPRRGHVHPGGGAVAEGGASCLGGGAPVGDDRAGGGGGGLLRRRRP